MSIRFPDLQVLFPRAGEVARTQQAMQRQPQLGQEQQAAHDQAMRQRQGQRAGETGADERVRYEQERQRGGSGRQEGEERRGGAEGEPDPALEGGASEPSSQHATQGEPGGRVDVRV